MKKIKVILIITLCCLKFSTVSAYDFSTVYAGQTLYFNITSDSIPYTVEVTSENTIGEHIVGGIPFYNTFPVGKIEIPSSVINNNKTYKVTSIGEYAFFGCNQITEIVLPNTILSIRQYAITSCTQLKRIHLSKNLEIIEDNSFSECISLDSIAFNNALKYLGNFSFSYCNSLESVYIPDSVTYIGYGAFCLCVNLVSLKVSLNNKSYKMEDDILYTYNKDRLSYCLHNKKGKIVIPNTVKFIESFAFFYHLGIDSLVIGESVDTIADCAFDSCVGIKGTLIFPNCVQYISAEAFDHCENITAIQFGNSVETIGGLAFSGCKKLSGELKLPNSLKKLWSGAFFYCDKITSIKFGDSLSSIPAFAFAHCNGLTEISFPDNIKIIENFAFNTCDSLSSITLGKSISSIESFSFFSCKINEIIVKAINPPIVEDVYTAFNCNEDICVYVPCDRKIFYEEDSSWSYFTNIIESSFDFNLEVKSNSPSMGTVKIIPPDCNTSIAKLTAVPKVKYKFVKWSDGNTDNPRTVIVTSDTTFTAIFKNKVGVEESDVNNTMNIYPNPATNQLTFDNGGSIMKEVCMYDVSGREVKRISISTNKITLDVSDLQRGMYVVKINTDHGVVTRKVQVIR